MAEDTRVLFWQNDNVKTFSAQKEEFAVNACCEEIYNKTPIINNEIINRRVISTAQTKKARINIITAILNGNDDENFYAGTNQEATIYRALFGKSEIGSFDVDNNLDDKVKVTIKYNDKAYKVNMVEDEKSNSIDLSFTTNFKKWFKSYYNA